MVKIQSHKHVSIRNAQSRLRMPGGLHVGHLQRFLVLIVSAAVCFCESLWGVTNFFKITDILHRSVSEVFLSDNFKLETFSVHYLVIITTCSFTYVTAVICTMAAVEFLVKKTFRHHVSHNIHTTGIIGYCQFLCNKVDGAISSEGGLSSFYSTFVFRLILILIVGE